MNEGTHAIVMWECVPKKQAQKRNLPEPFNLPQSHPKTLDWLRPETLCFFLRKIAHLDRILMFVSLCFHCFRSSWVQGMTNFVVSVFPAPDSPLIRTVLRADTLQRSKAVCVSVSENLADFSFYRKFHDRWHLLCWRHASQKSAAICPLMIWEKHFFEFASLHLDDLWYLSPAIRSYRTMVTWSCLEVSEQTATARCSTSWPL